MNNLGPKRKNRIQYYKPEPVAEDEMDFIHLLSFLFGFAGMIMKYKWAVWVSFFLALSSFLNSRNDSTNQ